MIQKIRIVQACVCRQTDGHTDCAKDERKAGTSERAPQTHLRRFVDGSHLGPDAQRNVPVLRVPSIQVPEVLASRLPPEVKEAVSNCVVLKHDIVHMPVFL